MIKAITKTYPRRKNFEENYKIMSAIEYVLGCYSINEDDSTKQNFLPYSWGYFTIIGLFRILAYLVTKFTEIKTIYFNGQSKQEKKKREKFRRL